ncbi:MAG: cupin domain-containing protein, partial [Thermoplasmata archaeon]
MCKGAGMKHMNFAEVKAVDAGEGAKGVKVRWLITDEDGARNFAMRVFDVEPDGYTPFHEHDWEHEMFVLKGGGRIKTEEKEERFERGEFFFIPPGFKHQFINDKKETLRFLCLIPYK